MIQEKRSNAQIAQLEIYTDGSCKKLGSNATFGGWSFIALRGGERIYEVAGSEYGTTNQRMELLAIRNALEFAQKNRHPNENVIIYSDSAYATNCYLQGWYHKWQHNGWTNSKGEDVAN
jgi:ribonuclease HI